MQDLNLQGKNTFVNQKGYGCYSISKAIKAKEKMGLTEQIAKPYY